MLHNFNSFDSDYILESIINESILYFSPNMRDRLKRMKDNDIANKLLELEGTDIKPDLTFIDIDDSDDGKISFIRMDNAMTLLNSKFKDIDIDKNPNIEHADILWNRRDDMRYGSIYTKGRNSIKIGKFVNKVFSGTVVNNKVEEFTNLFKASSERNDIEIKLVTGEEIPYWYNSDNYLKKEGSLGNSCMSNIHDVFDIYQDNPETCLLLIMTMGGQLVSRALIWKLNSIKVNTDDISWITRYVDKPESELISEIESCKYLVDRIYSIQDHYNLNMIDYINKNIGKNCLFKKSYDSYTFGKLELTGVEMTVKVKPKEYKLYPYLDTFSRYDSRRGILYNDCRRSKGGHILRSTQGSYEPSIKRTRIQRFKDFFSRS